MRESSTRRQLAVVVLGVAVLAAVLVGVWLTWFHSGYKELFADLRPIDAATIVADLDKRKIPYRLEKDGTTILVPAKVADATRLSVTSQDLPLKGVVGFELFNKSDMGLTEFAQHINYRRALEGELARTIMSLEGIESARIHLALAEPVIFREDRRASRASVTLIPRAGRTIPTETIQGVQRLVAAATTDLDVADVVVLDQRGAVVSGSAFAEPVLSPPSVGEQGAIETYYVARVRRALQAIYPDDQVRVTVAAEAAGGADAFAAWSPGARAFPLKVTIRIAQPVGPTVRDEILGAAAQAVGADPQAGDTLSVAFEDNGPPVAHDRGRPPAGPIATAPATVTAFDWRSPKGSVLIVLAVLLGLAAVGVAVLRRFRSAGRPLSPAQRQAIATRISDLFRQEAPDAAEHP